MRSTGRASISIVDPVRVDCGPVSGEGQTDRQTHPRLNTHQATAGGSIKNPAPSAARSCSEAASVWSRPRLEIPQRPRRQMIRRSADTPPLVVGSFALVSLVLRAQRPSHPPVASPQRRALLTADSISVSEVRPALRRSRSFNVRRATWLPGGCSAYLSRPRGRLRPRSGPADDLSTATTPRSAGSLGVLSTCVYTVSWFVRFAQLRRLQRARHRPPEIGWHCSVFA
jgi:hypothetical protein